MSIRTIIRGRVVDGPFHLEAADDEPVVTFMLGDRQNGVFRGKQFPVDDIQCCEVVCRGPWTEQLLATVHEDDFVVVLGCLRVSAPLDHYDDRGLVLVTVEAETVGLDLSATS